MSKTKDSHRLYGRGADFLNVQPESDGKAKKYQVREQLKNQTSNHNDTMPNDPRDYEIRIWYSPDEGDRCYVAQVLEWPGIMAHGNTREEAARQIQLALEGALEAAAEAGVQPPSPALAHA